MTREEANKVCGLVDATVVRANGTVNDNVGSMLKKLFPEYNWRVILDRSGQYTRARVTIDDNDPREHYFGRLGGTCPHCGKTARELLLPEDEQDEDEGECNAFS